MSGTIDYPAVPLAGPDGDFSAAVALDPRNGAATATVHGRAFASRPAVGRRRGLDTSFLDLRKTLRRAGYQLHTCGACQHFRYSDASRAMSAGLSGYCGLGRREAGPASFGAVGTGGGGAPVVTLYFGCPDWAGRDERDLADFFAKAGDA